MATETTIHDHLICEVVTSRSGTTSDWATEDPILNQSEFGIDLDSGKFKMGDGVTKWSELSYFISEASLGDLEGVPGPEGPTGPAGPAGTTSRAVANFTTSVLDDDAQETGTVDLARTYMVLKVATDVPARIRLYRDADLRTTDASRSTSLAPTVNDGGVLDIVSTL